MWKSSQRCWRMLTVVPLLVLGFMPTKADVSLNGISIDSTFSDVLQTKGAPHFIGPTLEDASDVTNILIPPPLSTAGSADTTGLLSGGMATPMGMPGAAPEIPQIPKGQYNYVIWMYQGATKSTPDQNAGYNTYVFLEKRTGKVAEVVVWLTNPRKSVSIQTPKSTRLGSSLTQLLKEYGYPKPFAKIGTNFVCPYPDQQTTFSIDATTKKVVGIAVGRKALTGILIQEIMPNLPNMSAGGPPMPPYGAPSPNGTPPAGLPAGALPGIEGQRPLPR